MNNYIAEKFKLLMDYLGIDPLYGGTLLVLVTYLIMYRKSWYILLEKGTSGLERINRMYLITQIIGAIVLLILCLMHFFKMF
jgi:hypothetical protein